MAYGDIPAAGKSDEGVMSDEGMAPESIPASPSYESEEESALAEAFPEMASDPMRLAAFRTAVQLCVDKALERSEGGGSEPPPAMKGKGGSAKAPPALVLAFGGKTKK